MTNTNHTMKIIFHLLILLLISIRCNKNDESLNPVNYNPNQKLEITPDIVNIGEELSLTEIRFHEKHFRNYIFFTGCDTLIIPRKGNVDTIFTHVPFNTVTGLVTVKIDCTEFSSNITVLESSPDAIEIKQYNLYNQIQSEDFFGRIGSDLHIWESTVSQDSVIFFPHLYVGDCGYATWDYSFRIVHNQSLPELDMATFYFYDPFDGEQFDTLRVGLIKIQDFDTTNVCSWRVISDEYSVWNYSYWYDFR